MNLSDETWLPSNHPVRLACGIISHAAIMLSGALSLLWLVEYGPGLFSTHLPSLNSIAAVVVAPSWRAGRIMEDIAHKLERL